VRGIGDEMTCELGVVATWRRRATGAARPCAIVASFAVMLVASFTLMLATAGEAVAHGDTIKVSYAAVRPEKLIIKAGTTVHFHNANASPKVCTIVFDEGGLESPALARAEGWHYTFEKPGQYTFHLKELPSRTGVIVVAGP